MPGIVVFLVRLLAGVALSAVGAMLALRASPETEQTSQELDSPDIPTGRSIPVIFGTMTISQPGIAWYGEKSSGDSE